MEGFEDTEDPLWTFWKCLERLIQASSLPKTPPHEPELYFPPHSFLYIWLFNSSQEMSVHHHVHQQLKRARLAHVNNKAYHLCLFSSTCYWFNTFWLSCVYIFMFMLSFYILTACFFLIKDFTRTALIALKTKTLPGLLMLLWKTLMFGWCCDVKQGT